jgi:SAM-dependent methyltransferase
LQLVLLRPRSESFKELEIVVLRHELSVLRRQVARPQLRPSDRLLLAAASRLLPRSRWRSFLVTPGTCCAGIGDSLLAARPTPVGPAGRCGSGGPALRLAEGTGASVVGVDVLKEGIATATRLVEERGLADRVRFARVDAGGRLPFADESFDAVISVDVMCHLPNRLDILRDWHRVTAPGARILFTDPTIVTGLVTDAEIADRSAIGVYVFSAESVNETLLARAGFEVSRREDLTENMAAMAGRWHDARARFRDDLLVDEGEATFEGIQRFLAASHVLARERRLSRYAYLARRRPDSPPSQDDRESSA